MFDKEMDCEGKSNGKRKKRKDYARKEDEGRPVIKGLRVGL